MTKAISQELANASNSNPVCAPYIRVDYSKLHWIPSIIEHEGALHSSKSKMRQYKSLRPLLVQQYVLYRLRFITSASLCKAFGNFGGNISQFIALSIIMQVAIADNPNVAMLYDGELRARLARYARERTTYVDYFQMLSALQVDILRMIPQKHARSMSAKAPPPVKKGGKNEENGAG